MKKYLWAALASFFLRNRNAVVVFISVLTLVMGYFASKVEITYEFAKLLPDNDSTLLTYQNFKKTFGEDGAVMVLGIQDSSFFTLDKFNKWGELAGDIKKINGIKEVVSVNNLYNLKKNDSLSSFSFEPIIKYPPYKQSQLDSIKNVLFSLPFYEGFIYSKDKSTHLMAITFKKELLNSKKRLSMVDSIKSMVDVYAEKYKLDIHYSGLPYIRTILARKIAGETSMFLGLAIIVTSFILMFFFRSTTPVIFSLLVVIIGVVWSLGTIVLFGYKITALSGLIPPLIIVIGIPNCILLLNKYHQEYLRHGNQAKSLARMVEKIGISTFIANLTTSIGFGVFCFTNSSILFEFGLVASINVMITYVISLALIPIIFSYLPPPSIKQIKHVENKTITLLLNKIDWWVHHQRKTIYGITTVLVIVSFFGMNKIKALGYVVDDLPEKDKIYTDLHFFESKFNGVLPFEISINTRETGGAFKMPTLYKINKLQKELKEYPEFSKPLSIVEAVKFANQALQGGDRKFYVLPGAADLSEIASLSSNSGRKIETFKSFIDSSKKITRISIQMADVGSVRIKELVNEIKPKVDSIFPKSQFDVSLTGTSIMFLKGNDYLIGNLKESVIFASILIALVMLLLFSSVRMVFISLCPSAVALIITAAIMGFMGIPLKPSTVLVFGITLGIASDGNMYFMTKYRQELRSNHYSISKTVSKTISETGISMIYTAFILFFGFGIFAVSDFGGTAALGYLISITLLVAYCSNLILLPCFLLSLEKRLISKAFIAEPLLEIWDEDEDIELDDLKIKSNESENKLG